MKDFSTKSSPRAFDQLNAQAQDTHGPLNSEPSGLVWLLVAAVATVIAWRLPYGNYLIYPFTILATWFHEMGHGLTALVTGGGFEKLLILPDGSGVAYHWAAASGLTSRLSNALVAAGGPMGPPLAGAAFIIASRSHHTARLALLILGGFLLLSVLLWVRSAFGVVAMTLWGIAILAIALKAPRWMQAFAIQVLGVQACLSTFHQVDYLFSYGANIGGQNMPSDSAQIAQSLWLPYWFWGGLMAVASLILLLSSLYIAYRPARKPVV
jgi:hypothetical protein